MHNFTTTVRLESAVKGIDKELLFPGVAFTIRRLSKIQRDRLTLSALEHQMKISGLFDRMAEIEKPFCDEKGKRKTDDAGNAMPLPPDVAPEYNRLDAEIGCISSAHVKPLYLRAALVKVEGIGFDGKPATADLLIENGPDELVEEIWLAINAHAKLTPEQRGNSQSATDSSGAAPAAEINSTATPAAA